MKRLILITFLCIASLLSYSQPDPTKTYFYQGKATIDSVLYSVTGAATCTNSSFSLGYKSEIKFVQVLAGDRYLIELVGNLANSRPNDNFAEINKRYCISKDFFDNNFKDTAPPKTRKDFGILAVPFKVRVDPIQITAGGELGGYFGWYLGDRSSSVAILHAGLTFISLNDINSETPETKVGFTGGIGFINKVNENFQLGLITGVDLFEGVEDWEYGYQPWVSLEIGYKFTK